MAQRWRQDGTFEASVSKVAPRGSYIFLEGPPTANGTPGIHHVLARTFKDLHCRLKTMQGYRVERKGGWDTHGLPVEITVEKKLGLTNKQQIEQYGIAPFNAACRESVFEYEKQWRALTQRMAYWVDMDHPYVTLEDPYIESVWWSLKKVADDGRLYKGHKVLPYCARCGTALSSHEVAQGYEEVTEPSVVVKLRLIDDPSTSILSWTTTPWTLPGNVALAVGATLPYVKVRQPAHPGETLILAEALLGILRGPYEVVDRLTGNQLVGLRYERLFPYLPVDPTQSVAQPDGTRRPVAWFVTAADFVTTTEGTGVVHTAVMYGEDDYQLGSALGLPRIHTVGEDGRFLPFVTAFAGQWVKDAEPAIIADLSARGLLYRSFDYTHSYPFCWRCDTLLLYYARDSWFIGMSQLRERMIACNGEVQWFPPHLQEGRFGDFLTNLKDWALSRERYWGTPLPVWRCSEKNCGKYVVIGSRAELQQRSGTLPAELHRPMVDAITFPCERCGSTMVREPYVIDVWYDSGAAFFAQWHYPAAPGSKEQLAQHFPIDYICEAVDQTRGWFYTLLAIAVLTQDSLCYRRVLSLGHLLDAQGKKMSKSRGNVVDPWTHLDREGADALRWYLISGNAPWEPMRFDSAALGPTAHRFLGTLWNCYSFLARYAALDGYDPEIHSSSPSEPSVLDQWLRSRATALISEVTEHLQTMEVHRAARALEGFVVDDLSNWYVRRSRDRFWGEEPLEKDADKLAAYQTLHKTLDDLVRLCAPLIPFHADELYRLLGHPTSVHLADWPTLDEAARDPTLEEQMGLVRRLCEAGHRLRDRAQLPNRQPLGAGELTGKVLREWRPEERRRALERLLAAELNVSAFGMMVSDTLSAHEVYRLEPEKAAIGPAFRRDAPAVIAALRSAPRTTVDAAVDAKTNGGSFRLALPDGRLVDVPASVYVVTRAPAEGYVSETVEGVTLVLDTRLDERLLIEGRARQVVRRLQSLRKQLDLPIDAQAAAQVVAPFAASLHERKADMERWSKTTIELQQGEPPSGGAATEVPWTDLRDEIDDQQVLLRLRRI